MPVNDNDPAAPGLMPHASDSHGQAALLLVESLIHGLCENTIISNGDAVAIVDRAVDVQRDKAEAADGAGAPMWLSHELLSAIAASLRTDFDDKPTPPRLVL